MNIQLASLRLEGIVLVRWESKLHKSGKKMDNLLSSWSNFVYVIRNRFYPLEYVKKIIMDWKTLRQTKGQSVQNFTKEFRKKSLELNIALYALDAILKYIGSLHHYLRHTLLLLHPTSLDETIMQSTHIESMGNYVQ